LPALETFEQVFKPLYGDSDKRWDAFRFISQELFALSRPVVIVETGSTRNPSNFAGDGCASLLWNYIARETKGVSVSIDIDIHASEVTQRLCPNTRIITSDSVTALRGYLPQPIDLLYLDSYDLSPGQEINAAMHQVAELGAIWNRLPSGCLIASDDCLEESLGKHVGTHVLMHALGIEPLLKSYIYIWKKP
jgi:hypothetical protein